MLYILGHLRRMVEVLNKIQTELRGDRRRLEVEKSAWGDNIRKLRRETSLKTFFGIAFLWDCKQSTYWKRL